MTYVSRLSAVSLCTVKCGRLKNEAPSHWREALLTHRSAMRRGGFIFAVFAVQDAIR